MEIISGISEMKNISRSLKKDGRIISFIPTMGKLHDGHIRLIEEGKKLGEVVVSIFVNPIQFGKNEDYGSYPRDIESDESILKKLKVPYLFYPDLSIVKDTQTFIYNPSGSDRLCGLFRRGHFQGVLTIVMKLFLVINPDFAFFGLKDYQQLVLIKKMAEDYFLDVKIISVPTAREGCGLAMSSRNSYLNETDKAAACNFYKSLKRTADLFKAGETSVENLMVYCIKELINFGFEIEYVKITDKDLSTEKQKVEKSDILLSAVKFKGVRLIDNIFFE